MKNELNVDDNFWAEYRAREEAERGKQADPSACGTCRWHVAEGRPVEHDGCAQRATLLEPPDMPSYEVLVDMTEDEKAALPARFHIPAFDDCGKPNAWLCRVCWSEGSVTGWPCATAVKPPDHEAEQQQIRDAAQKAEYDRLLRRVTELEAERDRLRDENAAYEKALAPDQAA